MTDRPGIAAESVDAVLVAADGTRLQQYEAALEEVRIQSRATLDADEAEALVGEVSPDVLVLDRGLPRLVLFRLYGLVREAAREKPVQIVFVGQEGDTGPDDHYLPGEPTPMAVAQRVAELVTEERDSAAPADDAAPADGGALTPVAAAASTAAPASPAPSEPASAPEPAAASTNGSAPDAEAPAAPAPKAAGRRLDVILIRVGLVLLILGALLFFIQSDGFLTGLTGSSAPPTPTRKPTASPKPAAFLPDAGVRVSAVVAQS